MWRSLLGFYDPMTLCLCPRLMLASGPRPCRSWLGPPRWRLLPVSTEWVTLRPGKVATLIYLCVAVGHLILLKAPCKSPKRSIMGMGPLL